MKQDVFPASAGVIPTGLILIGTERRLSRVSGGDPKVKAINIKARPSFPRQRG